MYVDRLRNRNTERNALYIYTIKVYIDDILYLQCDR